MTKSAAALRISESEKLTNGRNRRVPTLGQMIREAEADQQIIRRATRRALEAWFRQAARLHIAKHQHGLKGSRFLDFARRIGVDDQASAYQLVHLHRYHDQIMSDCKTEEAEAKQAGRKYHWPGWEAALSWHHAGRNGSQNVGRSMPNNRPPDKDDDFPAPNAIFQRFGSHCTLDVAASKDNAKCKQHYTREQDGLKQRWHGIVWMNPPYRDLAAWCAKAVAYARSGGTVIALLPAWTDAAWFHDFIPMARVTFLRSRLALRKMGHTSGHGAAPFGSMIVEWSPETVRRPGNGLNAHLDDRKRCDDTDAR